MILKIYSNFIDIKIRLSNLKHVYLDCFTLFTQELNLFLFLLPSLLKSVLSFIALLSFNMYAQYCLEFYALSQWKLNLKKNTHFEKKKTKCIKSGTKSTHLQKKKKIKVR